MVAEFCAYVALIALAGIICGYDIDRKTADMRAERRRLEYVVKRYNELTNDNYNPFED